mmetsp:Transcript_54756/g.108654  ORF Transcript_54756/g.108654 Transcript_54756/m.108654 type:complete len:212 (-) Transcript_54756:691-1326(-)
MPKKKFPVRAFFSAASFALPIPPPPAAPPPLFLPLVGRSMLSHSASLKAESSSFFLMSQQSRSSSVLRGSCGTTLAANSSSLRLSACRLGMRHRGDSLKKAGNSLASASTAAAKMSLSLAEAPPDAPPNGKSTSRTGSALLMSQNSATISSSLYTRNTSTTTRPTVWPLSCRSFKAPTRCCPSMIAYRLRAAVRLSFCRGVRPELDACEKS